MIINQVLGIETSCDDTSVAVVQSNGFVSAVLSANQDQFHAPYGGIVPEIAGRNHTLQLLPLVEQVLEMAKIKIHEVDGIAVTNRPGLVGSLLVGIATAKTMAQILNKPFVGVNHLEGHLQAAFLRDESYAPPEDFQFPYVALAVSGGHSTIYRVHDFARYEVLGATLDDAAGEAFDKFAKMIGLGFPGGVQVDRLAQKGDSKKFDFPRSMIKDDNGQMSFSGLKSSAHRLIQELGEEAVQKEQVHLCASFQAAITDVLIAKLDWAVRKTGLNRVVLTGGVSANSGLRNQAQIWAQQRGLQLVVPPVRYCTDNAAMIGYAGIQRLNRGQRDQLNLGPSPNSWPTDFIGENR